MVMVLTLLVRNWMLYVLWTFKYCIQIILLFCCCIILVVLFIILFKYNYWLILYITYIYLLDGITSYLFVAQTCKFIKIVGLSSLYKIFGKRKLHKKNKSVSFYSIICIVVCSKTEVFLISKVKKFLFV